MSSHPFAQQLSPAERERVVRVASNQRVINLVLLAYLVVAGMAGRRHINVRTVPVLEIIVPVILVIVGVACIVFAVRLANALDGRRSAIVHAILVAIPIVGLVALLVLNGRATRLLRRSGLHVGLVGVHPSQLAGWEIARSEAHYRK